MAAGEVDVLFGEPGVSSPKFRERLTTLEVEENADLPAAIQLNLPIATAGQDLTMVGDARFAPYARIAVVIKIPMKPDACIFDGYVLSQRAHLDKGTTSSTLRVWGQDVSCLMNLVERAKEWKETDGTIANTIFGGDPYKFKTAAENTQEDSGPHPDSGHTVMQRGTDAQFLRERARRTGRLFRVACTTAPGNANNTGYFIKPNLNAPEVATLVLNPADKANVDSLDFEWDVARPTVVMAQALIRAKDPVDGGMSDHGLKNLDTQSLAALVGNKGTKVMLTASVDEQGELQSRARSILREASWFVKCEGEVDLSRLDSVLRVGTIVKVAGAGKVLSGKYFVWSVRHTITALAHKLRFVLLRNALGAS